MRSFSEEFGINVYLLSEGLEWFLGFIGGLLNFFVLTPILITFIYFLMLHLVKAKKVKI